MPFRNKLLSILIVTPLSIALLSGCTSYGASYSRPVASVSCADALTTAVQLHRTGDPAQELDAGLGWFGDNCSDEYEIFTDYVSAKISVEQSGPEDCGLVAEHIRNESLAFLSEDGLCPAADVGAQPVEAATQPNGGIAWNEAVAQAGTTQRVCGPLVGSGNSYDDVFLNLGRDYPDPARFQIVIWDIGALEPIPGGSTLCTSGVITLHNGVAQIELDSPESVEIYE